MKSIYNEALASQKVFCKYYIRLVMDAFISFSKYELNRVYLTQNPHGFCLFHMKKPRF